MNIVHLLLDGPYTEGWGYQENILPKYHAQMNHNTFLITTEQKWSENGQIIYAGIGKFIISERLHLIRLKCPTNIWGIIPNKFYYYPVYELLCELQPDFIMLHDLLNFTVLDVKRYVEKENPNCRVIADSHSDSYNMSFNRGIKYCIFCLINRMKNRYVQKIYERVYGITPDAIQTAIKLFGINKSLLSLLPLGYDDEMIDKYLLDKEKISQRVRVKYGIEENTRLIVSGGKLSAHKRVLELIEAGLQIKNENVKIVIFGLADTLEYQKILQERVDRSSEKVLLAGFLNQEDIYKLFIAADVAVFPGTQSALWQMAIGVGLPLVVRYWPGVDYLNCTGNVVFVDEDMTTLINAIEQVLQEDMLQKMKNNAWKARENFSYRKEAQLLIER